MIKFVCIHTIFLNWCEIIPTPRSHNMHTHACKLTNMHTHKEKKLTDHVKRVHGFVHLILSQRQTSFHPEHYGKIYNPKLIKYDSPVGFTVSILLCIHVLLCLSSYVFMFYCVYLLMYSCFTVYIPLCVQVLPCPSPCLQVLLYPLMSSGFTVCIPLHVQVLLHVSPYAFTFYCIYYVVRFHCEYPLTCSGFIACIVCVQTLVCAFTVSIPL